MARAYVEVIRNIPILLLTYFAYYGLPRLGIRFLDNVQSFILTLSLYAQAADYALCRNLAAEWGPDNVRVNCIAPGLVKTEFARVLYEDPQRRAAREAATPLRRLGEPEDIGGVALMLASRAGAFITGQTIIVDGGTTIAP